MIRPSELKLAVSFVKVIHFQIRLFFVWNIKKVLRFIFIISSSHERVHLWRQGWSNAFRKRFNWIHRVEISTK